MDLLPWQELAQELGNPVGRRHSIMFLTAFLLLLPTQPSALLPASAKALSSVNHLARAEESEDRMLYLL